MLKNNLCISLLFFSFLVNAQFTVRVDGIKENDSITVIVQKGAEQLIKKYAKYNDGNTASVDFTLDSGEWAVKLDATGYTYPSQKVVKIPTVSSVLFTLTEATEGDFTYNWVDDGSAAGHSTQSYVAEPSEIVVLNDTVSVPSDFSSIKLRTAYGVVLSDSIKPWSKEDSYRLYKMFSNLPYNPFGEGSTIDFSSGENVRGVFMLTDNELPDDITINNDGEVPYATVSQSAFTYANPQIVKLDGIRGKFYSKRLYHTVVNFITDFGNKEEVLNWLAEESFGIQFVKPSQFAQVFKEDNGTYMGDDNSNFQDFYKTEKLEILSMFEELPEGFHKQEGLKYIVRRIDGQDHPDPAYKQAAAIAWTGLKTIEFMSKAFIGSNLSDVRRLILHEKAHFLWEYTFDDTTKKDWTELGGWFEDPTSASGWSTYNTTEFVSAYAHLKNPNEDMAESIAIYLTNPDRLINVSQKKYEFIRDRIMHGTRYVSIIREDLTFTVYNLYPDYTFPGKIVELDLKVEGAPEEDKTITMEVRLASENPAIDGATEVYTRFSSSIGTIFDIRLTPKNGYLDSVLVGSATLSKYAKNGYWNLSSAKIYDQVRNARYENTSTVGAKLFISSPLEDLIPPKFLDYNLSVIDSTFNANGEIDPNGEPGQAIKIVSKWEEINTPLKYNGDYSRIDFPNPDQAETYYKEVNSQTINPQDTIKVNVGYMYIPEYYPSGYYATTALITADPAGNNSWVQFSNNPDNNGWINNFNNFGAVKDSVYVETKYPDIVKPEIDLNNITVVAEPTNPQAPNGETRVDINFNARDLSDFPGYEAGVYSVSLLLRDPQGKKYGFQTGNTTMNHPDLDLADTEPVLDNKWRNYRFDLVLPQGSAPGVWGISDIVILDKVGNTRSYNFEEYVRFDIIESDIQLEEALEIEITDKVINAGNVNAIKAKMSCKPCTGLNYVATIYSRFGGGAVVRSEGTLSADEQIIENLNTTGILDGEVNLTVQLTDSEDKLIATKTTAYTKDVVYPSAYYTRTNLQNDGTSSLDEFTVDVVIETQDVGGSYNLNINLDGVSSKTSNITTLSFTGNLNAEETRLTDLDISSLSNGVYKFNLSITDPNGNKGAPETLYYLIENENITLLGTTNTLSSTDNTLPNLTMYPNPVEHFYYINFNEELLLEVFDMYGKMIMKKKIDIGTNKINTTTLSAGHYFFKVTTKDKHLVKRIIKK
ncbi:T9SS type A sorting domain-containing protein [Polaribacter tangerinus]|uniref:T9SS type A sorting domain-containing protein n=1 Tax=Polaribacter tangerinus TaxID=1920034 RepID=UPI000B4B2A8C|nr:T9SS type A sorting domain-containing protein [Polaribacter tangerinus]